MPTNARLDHLRQESHANKGKNLVVVSKQSCTSRGKLESYQTKHHNIIVPPSYSVAAQPKGHAYDDYDTSNA